MRFKADLILLFVAAIWGTGFLAQRLATAQLNAFYFNGGRFLIAALVILLVTRLQKESGPLADPQQLRRPVLWMVLAGGLLFAAAGLQQAGLATTSIGNASFITGLYVVLVPVILFVFLRQQISWLGWLAVLVAAAGVALLGLQGRLRFAPGDLLELVGALMWALHVITVGWLARKGIHVLWFSVIQYATCAALNLGLAFALDPAGVQGFVTAWPVVLYSALIPISLGYTLQVVGQKYAPALDAAILLSMEGVFATVLAFLVFNEQLGPRQVLGCAMILAATVLAQLRVEAPLAETVS